MDFKNLMGKMLSILITGKGNKKESYMGILVDVDDKYISLKTLPNDEFEIENFIIRLDLIESVWIYKE